MFTFSEAELALNGREEFIVKRYDECLVVVDYIVAFPDSFEGLRRNLRGVVFDERTGEILSLPLHKFYNVNQTEQTQFRLLKDRRATIYEKLDGSMIHFFIHPIRNQLLASTRKSTETSQAKTALTMAISAGLEPEIRRSIDEGWTPIFEYVAASNQIVVEYPESRLVYLLSRNRKTGEYRCDIDRFPDSAQRFEFAFSDLLSNLEKEDFEGYVCHLDDGQIVKAKTSWYLQCHRCVDAMMRPKYKLYEAVFSGVIDDILPTAPDKYRGALEAIYHEAQSDWLHERQRLERTARNALLSLLMSAKSGR